MTVEPAVADAHIGAVDVAVGNGRLANAALEAADVVEQAQVFDYHRRARAQLMIAVRAQLLAGHAQHVHRRKHRHRRR